MSVTTKSQWRALLAQARAGDPEAQWEVGYHYDEGLADDSGSIIVRPQPKRALHWYTLSAEQGNDGAQLALGVLLSTGEGVERDDARAIHWTRRAASQGSSAAAFNLGTIYRDLGRPRIAFRWYKRSADMGDRDSLLSVGLCYFFGFGVKQDFQAAYERFCEVLGGDPAMTTQASRESAMYWMAICHLLGLGGARRSIAKARELLETADKDEDLEQANELLGLLGKTGRGRILN